MRKFWQSATVVGLPEPLRLRSAQERGVSDQVADRLRMVREPGRYSGRKVTYFQVFDPATLPTPSAELHRFADLDAHRVVHSGHIERDDGRIVPHLLRTGETEPASL